MLRRLIIAGAVFFQLACLAKADPILFTDAFPAFYTPGASFTLDVKLTGADDLNSFFVELYLSGSSGTPGVDFYFDDTVTVGPSDPQYVFGGDGFFFTSLAGTDLPNGLALISLSDALADPLGTVSTVAGVNDLIARVTVRTTGDVGVLTFGINTTTSPPALLNPDFATIPNFSPSSSVSGPATIGPSAAVPEPGSLTLFSSAVGTLIIAARLRRARVGRRIGLRK